MAPKKNFLISNPETKHANNYKSAVAARGKSQSVNDRQWQTKKEIQARQARAKRREQNLSAQQHHLVTPEPTPSAASKNNFLFSNPETKHANNYKSARRKSQSVKDRQAAIKKARHR